MFDKGYLYIHNGDLCSLSDSRPHLLNMLQDNPSNCSFYKYRHFSSVMCAGEGGCVMCLHWDEKKKKIDVTRLVKNHFIKSKKIEDIIHNFSYVSLLN